MSSAASDSVTLDFVQSCLDNDCVGNSDCLHYTKAFVFKEIMQQSNKATFIVLVTEECLQAGSHQCHWSTGHGSAHTSQVVDDVQLNSTMRLISSTLRPTLLPWLQVLSNVEPPALRRKAATDKLVEKIVKHDSWPIQPDILSPPLLQLTSRKLLWLDLQPVDIKR